MSEAKAVIIFLDSDKKHEVYEAVEPDLSLWRSTTRICSVLRFMKINLMIKKTCHSSLACADHIVDT